MEQASFRGCLVRARVVAAMVAAATVASGAVTGSAGTRSADVTVLVSGASAAGQSVEHVVAGLGGQVLRRFSVIDGFAARLPGSAVATLSSVPGVRPVVAPAGTDDPGFRVAPMVLAVAATDLVARAGELLEECFGPAALVIEYGSAGELEAALDVLPGSLTATLHADPATEDELARRLLDRFATRAGRLIWDGWPTGVAVAWAMQHGGPWPATTNALHTSVGMTGIRRWLRPVTYQSVPDAFLPPALQEANPLRIPRRVNGVSRSPDDKAGSTNASRPNRPPPGGTSR